MKAIGLIIGVIILVAILVGAFILIKIPGQGGSLPQRAMLPNVEFEGTIISLSLVGGAEEGGDITRPRDTGVIRIDKINSISDNFDWISAGIEEGNEITIQFQNSARPAKIKQIPDPEAPISSGDESPVSATLSFTKENGYFIYSTKSGTITEETETILSGLEEGFKFSARGSYGYAGLPQSLTIGEYEIIF